MGFNAVVLAKEIYDTRDLIGDVLDASGKVRRDALESRFDPEDLNALEMALKIKDGHGGKVTCLSVGAPRRLDVLRECLYRGADGVIRLEDEAFVGLDTLAAARVLAKAVQRLGGFDLVLTGVQVVEGRGAERSPAELRGGDRGRFLQCGYRAAGHRGRDGGRRGPVAGASYGGGGAVAGRCSYTPKRPGQAEASAQENAHPLLGSRGARAL